MQDHAKTRLHIWSLKSNTNLNPQRPQWSRHCERPPKLGGALKKEIFGCFFKTPRFLGKWYGVATYFLYKKKKKLNTIYMTELFLYH